MVVSTHQIILLLLVGTVAIVSALNLDRTAPIVKRTHNPVNKWSLGAPAHSSDTISFKLRNTELLERIFWEVNDPKHPHYGKFLSLNEVNDIIAPEPETVNKYLKVLEWLLTSIPQTSLHVFPGFIFVSTTVGRASDLFNTAFHWYQLKGDHKRLIRIHDTAYLPVELLSYVDFVVGISELFDSNHEGPVRRSLGANVDNTVTPAILKSYLTRNPQTPATNKKNLQAVADFDTYCSLGALAAFDKFLALASPNVTRDGTSCFPDCDQTEGNVDVQYITALGSGVPTIFQGYATGEWVLDWALAANTLSKPPLVNSISYGWSELEQCEMTVNCEKLGYNSKQYVNRSNVEFQALGVKGVSILVANGDDGAPSLAAASGNCPMDHTKYCPSGKCTHTASNCTEITIIRAINNTEQACFFPMGLGNDICAAMVNDPNWNTAMKLFESTNSKCKIAIESDSQYEPHIYSYCSCDELKPITSTTYKISAYVFNQTQGPVFSANFPATSPYVTAVGATQFVWKNNNISSEISASILTGAFITTGGGFSSVLAQPSYQTTFIANYFKESAANLPPSFSYSPQMRGFPDVSFNGHNLIIFESNNTNNLDTCPCQNFLADGTGCSTPSFAGMISLINDKLLNAGKSPLGFLNPLLYQMASSKPSAFNDITSGENKCNRVYCCLYGYTASSGWDPVSGLGTPNYPVFESYILTIKNVTM